MTNYFYQKRKKIQISIIFVKNLKSKTMQAYELKNVNDKELALRNEFVSEIRKIIVESKTNAARSIDDNDKREYYEYESLHNAWTGRELERQINSGLYERLLLSNDKESVLEVARRERIPENPEEITIFAIGKTVIDEVETGIGKH